MDLALALSKRDGGFNTLCHSCEVFCKQKLLKRFPVSGYLLSKDRVVWLLHLLVNLYIWLTISFCCSSTPLVLGLIFRDGGLSTLCQSCESARQQKVLKTFPDTGYLLSEDTLVWLWYFLVNLYIWLTISSCYGWIITYGLTVHKGGMCFEQPVSELRVCFPTEDGKKFSSPGYLLPENGVVWIWHILVNLYILLTFHVGTAKSLFL